MSERACVRTSEKEKEKESEVQVVRVRSSVGECVRERVRESRRACVLRRDLEKNTKQRNERINLMFSHLERLTEQS